MILGNKGQKIKAWKGFFSYAPNLSIMSLVTKNSQKPAFAPLVAKTLVAKKVITLRWNKEVSFAHQPYCALESVPDRIRWLRMQMGLTQKEAAEKIGVGRPTYGDYETGVIERFDLGVIRKIAELYEVPVNDLLDSYNAFLMNGQGKQLRQWRTSLSKNPREMAEYLGVAVSNIVTWEREEKIMTKKLYERCFGFKKHRKV